MKKLYLMLVLCGLAISGTASHYAGAEIGYEHISTNANGSHVYKVNLQLYRDISGIPMDLVNQRLCITSSCFNQQDLLLTFLPVLPQDGGNVRQALPVPDLASCVDANDQDMVTIEIYFFETTVTLPGNCSDFKFSWRGNARNTNNIDNLTFVGSCGSDLYVEAILNNTIGQNTSPVFVNPAAKAFCVGSPFTWSQAATEPNNDSLRYMFGNPLNTPYVVGACATPCLANFAPGYSMQQPMTTLNGITIDQKNGTFYFTPTQIETDVVNVIVEEYRYDSTLTVWLKIGNTVRDLQIPIVGQCLQAASSGPKINTSAPGFTNQAIDKDSLRTYLYGIGFTKAIFDSSIVPGFDSIGVVSYHCGDSVITLSFNNDVLCSSISPDGTDFRLIGPDSTLAAIPAVNYVCGNDLTTNNIQLLLHQPLDKNGNYFLQIKNGNDGNTLQNECGFSLSPFYTLMINVTGCTNPIYMLENVTVVADTTIQIEWSKVDSTIPIKLFTGWNILRSNNNWFYPVGTVNNYNATSFVDLTVDANAVDNIEFKYAVQLIQNYKAKDVSAVIGNILLRATTQDDNTIFEWNEYEGWATPEYTFEYRNTSNNEPWQALLSPVSATYSYSYSHPAITAASQGIYAYRVIASNPAPPAAFQSESNWLYLEFKHNPVVDNLPTIENIPNVITPNGDSQNDLFTLDYNTYSNVSLSIYNRWGELIFQDINAPSTDYAQGNGWDGTNAVTGQPVSDGVYYFLLKATDIASGKSEEVKGPLTIIRGTP